MPKHDPSRRQFMAFLAGSRCWPQPDINADIIKRLLNGASHTAAVCSLSRRTRATNRASRQRSRLRRQALNVFDFRAGGKDRIPVAHWATWPPARTTMEPSAQSRRLRAVGNPSAPADDVSHVDAGVTLFGAPLSHALVISPVGSQKAFIRG